MNPSNRKRGHAWRRLLRWFCGSPSFFRCKRLGLHTRNDFLKPMLSGAGYIRILNHHTINTSLDVRRIIISCDHATLIFFSSTAQGPSLVSLDAQSSVRPLKPVSQTIVMYSLPGRRRAAAERVMRTVPSLDTFTIIP